MNPWREPISRADGRRRWRRLVLLLTAGAAVLALGLVASYRYAPNRPVTYTDLPADAFLGVLTGAGLPEPVAAIFVDVDVAGVSRGLLQGGGGDLARLIGRPTTPLADTIAAALKG